MQRNACWPCGLCSRDSKVAAAALVGAAAAAGACCTQLPFCSQPFKHTVAQLAHCASAQVAASLCDGDVLLRQERQPLFLWYGD
jgi:hypothetical protein